MFVTLRLQKSMRYFIIIVLLIASLPGLAEAQMRIDKLYTKEFEGKLVIVGAFAQPPDSVICGGTKLPITSVSTDTIVCSIPDTGVGSSGSVTVYSWAMTSNTHKLVRWSGTVSYSGTASAASLEQMSKWDQEIAGVIAFRADPSAITPGPLQFDASRSSYLSWSLRAGYGLNDPSTQSGKGKSLSGSARCLVANNRIDTSGHVFFAWLTLSNDTLDLIWKCPKGAPIFGRSNSYSNGQPTSDDTSTGAWLGPKMECYFLLDTAGQMHYLSSHIKPDLTDDYDFPGQGYDLANNFRRSFSATSFVPDDSTLKLLPSMVVNSPSPPDAIPRSADNFQTLFRSSDSWSLYDLVGRVQGRGTRTDINEQTIATIAGPGLYILQLRFADRHTEQFKLWIE